jgi:hypothetical protein
MNCGWNLLILLLSEGEACCSVESLAKEQVYYISLLPVAFDSKPQNVMGLI